MTGDVYTDALVAKLSGGDGTCSQCGAERGTLQHILWRCPGKEGVLDSIRKGEGTNPLTAELMGVGTKEGLCLLFAPDPTIPTLDPGDLSVWEKGGRTW